MSKAKPGPTRKLPKRRNTEAHSLEQPEFAPQVEAKRDKHRHKHGRWKKWFDDDPDSE